MTCKIAQNVMQDYLSNEKNQVSRRILYDRFNIEHTNIRRFGVCFGDEMRGGYICEERFFEKNKTDKDIRDIRKWMRPKGVVVNIRVLNLLFCRI